MSSRIDNLAPPGSLFKQPRLEKPHKKNRSDRVEDEEYLKQVRQLPCLSCGMEPCGTAAHVRMGCAAHGKTSAMQRKPDDKWALPLCHPCHMEQHSEGELTFWHRLNLSPVLICVKLYEMKGSVDAMRAVIMAAFRLRAISPHTEVQDFR